MGTGTALFLDTTILIGLQTHEPRIKRGIKERLEGCFCCSGLVCRAEYKRRLLKVALYLHGLSRSEKSFTAIRRRIEHLPPQQSRKSRVCLQILDTVDERDGDSDKIDRLALFTRRLLKYSLSKYDRDFHFFKNSGCACGKSDVVEVRGQFRMEPDSCAKAKAQCAIANFLDENVSIVRTILESLSKLSNTDKTPELKRGEEFLRDYLDDPADIHDKNPCSSVGDILIALESASAHIPTFYTMNIKESRVLCEALEQTLIYRHPTPIHDEQVIGHS